MTTQAAQTTIQGRLSQVPQSNIIHGRWLWKVKYWSILQTWRITWKYLWNQGKTLPISYTAIHSLYVWPALLMSPNTLNLYCTSSKISYQLTMPYMAATSAYKSFINLFPVYPYILQSLTKLLLYVKNPMEYFTTQQNTRNWISLPLSMATHLRWQKMLQRVKECISTEHEWWLCTIPL